MAEEQAQAERSEFVEHMQSARRAAYKQWASLVPEGFREHGREASREFLLAMRSLVEGALERMDIDETDETDEPATKKVKVEVEEV
jgi:hypothetical protein